MDLPAGPFDVILADPPWDFGYWSDQGKVDRHIDRKYPLMTTDAVCALPVADAAARDAVLLLWATVPNLLPALRVLEAWGFSYRTVAFTWVKVNADHAPFMGMGYYTRQNAELCLLGVRGRPLKRCAHDVPSVLVSRRREHSRKPDGQYDHIERLFGADVRRLELFARRRWPGWVAWGNEVAEAGQLALPLTA